MTMPPTITAPQRTEVLAATEASVRRGEALFERQFDRVPVVFDLRGRAAGMYRIIGERREIRFNPHIFARHFDDCIARTVPHEVAHSLCHQLYGWDAIRPHGAEWRALMLAFGADAGRTHNYDLDGLPRRVHAVHAYRCDCQFHQLGSRRHQRASLGQAVYRCRECGHRLRPIS